MVVDEKVRWIVLCEEGRKGREDAVTWYERGTSAEAFRARATLHVLLI